MRLFWRRWRRDSSLNTPHQDPGSRPPGFVETDQGLATTIINGPLSSVADGTSGVFNELPGGFPASTFHNSNYFRDVLFTPFSSSELWTMNAGLADSESPTGDTNGDGMNLFLEFALGSDPQIQTDVGTPTFDADTYTFNAPAPTSPIPSSSARI